MSGEVVQEKNIALRDIEVAYRESGEGQPVVLIHGLAQDHRMWTAQQDELRGQRTIAYDVRGHGGTTIGDADGTLRQLGEDLVALLEEVGPATCVGFSLGGTVALWAAAARPDLVPDLVVLATSSVVGSAAAGFFADRIALFSKGDRAEIAAALREDTKAQLGEADADLEAIVVARLQAVADGAGYVNAARAMAAIHDDPLNTMLETLTQPVKVISGERDRFCPRRAAEIMLEHLPNASFEELPQLGHLLTDEDPGAVTRAIAAWLAGEERR
ncbi:MAG TPA: alpha/beta hydrolase [Solirubrobacterales bacterium]|jgi:pimeloyl-ACP methyl ester carboxylesterase|nr:alpha/beta hydrolase [Solirubrobacterales bacterium]